jgi:hypothetical protein
MTVLVVFAWNAVPDGGVDVTVTLLQASVATTLHVTMMLLVQVNAVMFDGQTMDGGVVSTTVTVWEQLVLLVQQSVATHVRVIVEKHGPWELVIVPATVIMTFVPQQASVAPGGSKVHAVPHSTTLLVAQVSTGGVESMTETFCVQTPSTAPPQSMTVQMPE